ncbi:MAG: hypothetical protein HY785_16320 [Oscillatoriophycideae cyanobacterium NC_groundwater_1537_Pr4_S-0.65um_50_18]|nr:hypothetical protein [Oscillatoriophycideae cyanobacterium NC_groundwater_1537_Pr4_S-0.65um_50_18]
MLSQSSKNPQPLLRQSRSNSLWFERIMAIAALINLLLVLFDLSYIPWRDLYLRQFPQFTQWYGTQFKGIEPHRSTETYLRTIKALENQVASTGLRSPQTEVLLSNLRSQSAEMIDENPFEGAGKAGTLERIKRRMRDRMEVVSSKQAFINFWNAEYLSQSGWTDSISFFDRRIAPLVATNYYRGIGENGEPIDLFWQIDLGFVALFAVELLARTFYLSHRPKKKDQQTLWRATWLDTLVWRWYDLLLLLPFWRWLRVIPVVTRLNQAQLINLNPLNASVAHGVVSAFATEITEAVVLQVIDQVQELLRQGAIARWLIQGGRQYIDLNGIDEGAAITKHLTMVMVDQVLPQIRPDLDALMQHILTRVLNTSPLYAGLQHLPGASEISSRVTQQIVSEATNNTQRALKSALEDEVGAKLFERLIVQLGAAFQTEVQRNPALTEIQSLAIALLEEVKINYVKQD